MLSSVIYTNKRKREEKAKNNKKIMEHFYIQRIILRVRNLLIRLGQFFGFSNGIDYHIYSNTVHNNIFPVRYG
jgi:hypothetical protein